MKALTLTQPWATLVISGAKHIETRSWRTAFRGRIAIHAAMGMPRWARAACYEIYFRKELAERNWDELPRGCVIGTVDVVDCRPTESFEGAITEAEREMGDFSPGRFGWVLANPLPMTPNPARGALGLWEWSPSFIVLCGTEADRMSDETKDALAELGKAAFAQCSLAQKRGKP